MTDPRSFGKVGVLLGGLSAEHDISLMSGNGVLAALRSKGVDAHPFDPSLRPIGELAREGFDRVFIALHGRFGEDGAIQGALEPAGHPVHRERRDGIGDRDGQGVHETRVAEPAPADARGISCSTHPATCARCPTCSGCR